MGIKKADVILTVSPLLYFRSKGHHNNRGHRSYSIFGMRQHMMQLHIMEFIILSFLLLYAVIVASSFNDIVYIYVLIETNIRLFPCNVKAFLIFLF